ncbi:MAG: hypothetical protein QGH33_13835, partial [Pirellulaceae bacterium]|nr:hypothetical protein [Pirellulaceae bacterium]
MIKTFSGHQALVTSLKFSPGGEKLASGSKDQTVRVWDVASGQLQTTLTGHIWPVGRVVFLPDGKRLASVSADLSVRIWDTETGQLENSF